MSNTPTSRTEEKDGDSVSELDATLQRFAIDDEDIAHYVDAKNGEGEPIKPIVTKVAAAINESQVVRELVGEIMFA